MTDYAGILTEFYPGTEWYLGDTTDYETLRWDTDSEKPTKEELESKA